MNGKGYKVLIGLLAVVILALAAVVVVVLRRPAETQVVTQVVTESGGNNGMTIGYASDGVTVIDDADALQRAVDEEFAKSQRPGIGIRYQNDAYSSNGKDFSCYIGNSTTNVYDMFIAIYADDAFEDLLFLSQLIKPGQAFEHITLERALDPGDYVVNCVYTQVEVVDGQQSIHAQTAVTLNFHVSAS